MMKRTITCLLLVLALLCGIAQAEEAVTYTPGAITEALFGEAFDSGKLVMADLSLDLDLAPELLEGEDAAVVSAALQVLRSATLSVGAAKLEDGLLLTLAGTYAADPAQSVAAQVFLGVTADGLWVETDVLPGERVTIQWETLLSMLGADEATIEQIMALRDADLEQVLADLMAELETMLEQAMEVAAPYGQILMDFVSNLPMSTEEDVPSDGFYPAAKSELYIEISEKALGELITALANQLEQDATLSPIVDALLAEQEVADGEEPMTTAALCAALRTAASEMTDEENPAQIYLGTDESGDPLYFVVYVPVEDALFTVTAVNADPSAEAESWMIAATVAESAEEDAPFTGISLQFVALTDPEDENVCSFSGSLELYVDSVALMSMSMEVSSVAITTAESLPGYATNVGMSMQLNDGEDNVNMVTTVKAESGMTADGGEYQTSTGRTEIYDGDARITEDVTVDMRVSPSESGPVARYVETVSMPDTGVNSMTVKMDMYTTAYEPAADLAVLALESASSEDMDGLMTRLMTNGTPLMQTLMAQLPPELLEALSEEAPATVE